MQDSVTTSVTKVRGIQGNEVNTFVQLRGGGAHLRAPGPQSIQGSPGGGATSTLN